MNEEPNKLQCDIAEYYTLYCHLDFLLEVEIKMKVMSSGLIYV